MDFFQTLSAWWQGFVIGFVAFPVTKYIVTRYGAVMVEDLKKVMYKVWDVAKARV